MPFRWKQMDFVSEIDQHFEHWKASMPLSTSQQIEIEKYDRINQLRDNANRPDESDPTNF